MCPWTEEVRRTTWCVDHMLGLQSTWAVTVCTYVWFHSVRASDQVSLRQHLMCTTAAWHRARLVVEGVCSSICGWKQLDNVALTRSINQSIYFCLSKALYSSIGQNIKSPSVSDVRSEYEKLRMAITPQRIIRSTSCFVLGWVFLARTDKLCLKLNCSWVTWTYNNDIGLLLRETLDRLRVRLNHCSRIRKKSHIFEIWKIRKIRILEHWFEHVSCGLSSEQLLQGPQREISLQSPQLKGETVIVPMK